MGERSGAPSGLSPASIVISKPPVAVQLPQPDVSDNRDAPQLGILTGVGFIGGGAILKRGDAVHGLTTAATLWFVTVVGLCFGGGQVGLGLAGSVLGFLTLRALKTLERRLPRERASELWMKWKIDDADVASGLSRLKVGDLKIIKVVVRQSGAERVKELRCSVRRQAPRDEHEDRAGWKGPPSAG
jgi:putative Mg2+ transporter-C (MgtC) family protein